MSKRKTPDPLAVLAEMQRRSLGYVLIRCGQLFNERGMARVNAEAGGPMLREAHTRLLPFLQDPQGVRITDVARRLEVSKQAVQQLVGDLLEAGVVRFEVDPDDARAKRVRLTELGVHAMQHGTGVLLELEREVVARLGARDVKQLHRLLTGLLGVLEERPS
jgi:DNA-binding MarR family transcriptional regulator